MDKKTLPLVIILVVIIVFYSQILQFLGLSKPAPSSSEQPVVSDTVATAVETPPEQPVAAAPVQETSSDEQAVAVEQLAQDSLASPVRDDTVWVTTNTYEVALTSRGGGPVSMVLREYTLRDGSPIDMLGLAEHATPEAVFAGGTYSTSDIGYECNLEPGTYAATSSYLDIEYTHTTQTGGTLVRRFRFYPDEYHYDLTLSVNDPGSMGFERQYSLVWNTPLGVTEPQAESDYSAMEAVAMQGGSREKLDDWDEGRLGERLEGYTSWAGVREKYFAAILIPMGRDADGALARGTKEKVATPDGRVEVRRIVAGLDMPFAATAPIADSFKVFVGPLDYWLLSDYDVDLEAMLDIGTTPLVGWLIKPFALGIMWLLPRMYDFIPNYGVVIIVFALLVKIITLPLSMRSFKSMQAMRDLQPRIKELQAKHKKDQAKLSQETMKLYKEHGVNPLSGCLPIIPQMPLFFALFSVFRSTILLRDAPFVWFLNDLSRGASSFTDPYIILVVIMVAAQFVSQSVTMPSTQQNKAMMYIMPLFFGFIFYKFAAGLVLYWTCFSVFSLLDYVLFKRDKAAAVKAA